VDEVAPVVAAVAKDFLPEAFRVAGVLVVIFSVHPRLASLPLVPLLVYIVLSYGMTRRLEKGVPGSGESLVDGVPLGTVDPSSVRAEIAVVSADGALFRGSIGDNIRYRRPDASEGALIAECLGRTMLVIAHRASMVEIADRVFVLEGGRVAEEGTVEELRGGGGWFSWFARAAMPADTAG
jgi:ABC-type multidrug transport system fused ATPase/permease subunit